MKIQDIIEPARHLPFKIMITDPVLKHARWKEVKNPFSGESGASCPDTLWLFTMLSKAQSMLEDGMRHMPQGSSIGFKSHGLRTGTTRC